MTFTLGAMTYQKIARSMNFNKTSRERLYLTVSRSTQSTLSSTVKASWRK